MSFDNHLVGWVAHGFAQVVIIAFLLSFAGTAWLSSRFRPFGILDAPNERSLHVTPTPRTGGVAIVVALIIGISYLVVSDLLPRSLVIGCGTALLVSTISFVDDIYRLPALLRLAVQVLATGVAIGAGVSLLEIHLPGISQHLPQVLAGAITFVFVVWVTNLYNFMDGMDGFAGGMAIVGFATLGYLGLRAEALGYAAICFSIAAASAGFLVFNFPPARIFMGDVGSSTLGFMAGVMGIWADRQNIAPLWVTVLIFSPFIVDATVTLLRRLFAGEKVWQAHREHYYQRLVQVGWGHRRIVLYEYLLMLAAAGSALAAMQSSRVLVQWFVVLVWIAIYVALAWFVDRSWRASLAK